MSVTQKLFLIVSLLLVSSSTVFSQSLSINTDGSTANPSAMLDVKSTTKGLLIPRMNKAQRNAIVAPATSLLVYQNAPDSMGFYFYDGSIWTWLSNPNPTNAWNINGNSGTNVFTNYLGTNEPSVLTLSSLYGYFSKILKYHFLADKSKFSAASALGVNPFFVEGYARAAASYDTHKLKNIFSYLKECDLKTKGVDNPSIENGELLKELVFKILH